jgi:glycolate oxidase iron-sulfur subunit
MQTHFSSDQLKDPAIARADSILRSCVHCGFCTATCPTFVLTGDERDSPRGRIWMMRELLENPESISADTGYHLDRCLGCLSCTTTCPSGVDYPHLLDIGRAKMDKLVKRTWSDRLMRRMLARVIPYAGRFHAMMRLARIGQLFRWAMPKGMRRMLDKVPRSIPSKLDPIGSEDAVYHPDTKPVRRVAMLAGCASRALEPDINAASIRLLNRLGIEVRVYKNIHCCGALAHHIGETEQADKSVHIAVERWYDAISGGEVDAIITNASGCGTMVKDYGDMLQHDPAWAARAAAVSAASFDISELLAQCDWATCLSHPMAKANADAVAETRLAYHSACSLQHGQKIHALPKRLLEQVGFAVVEPRNGHLCCGSAGVYNILQPEMADGLKARKQETLHATGAAAVAAGNIGCITQLHMPDLPVRHTVQFLDWATGGDKPF